MKIYEEKKLKNIKFWGGAVDRVKYLTEADLERIEESLNGLFHEGISGISEESLNDMFWFNEDFLAEILGFQNFEEIIEKRKEEIERMGRDF